MCPDPFDLTVNGINVYYYYYIIVWPLIIYIPPMDENSLVQTRFKNNKFTWNICHSCKKKTTKEMHQFSTIAKNVDLIFGGHFYF